MTQEMNVNQKAVQFLMGVACRRETTYYEALAIECGLPTQGNALSMAVTKLLLEIFHWCDQKGLPPLTALVVRKSGKFKGQHGQGFWKVAEESGLLNRHGIELENATLDDTDYAGIGQFFIVKVWNYFADLKPRTNASAIQTVSNGSEFPNPWEIQSDLKRIIEILESIPGFADLPEHIRGMLKRGQSVLSVEIIHDRIAEIMEGNNGVPSSAAFAWSHVLKSIRATE